MNKNRLFAGILIFGIGLLIWGFFLNKTEEAPVEQTPAPVESSETPTEVPAAELQPEKPEPLPSQIPPLETPQAIPANETLLTSPADRDSWRECMQEEPPVQDNLEDWARNQSSEPEIIHWSNLSFKNSEGKEFRLRYVVDDGPDELPIPQLQLFSVDDEGNPADLIKKENMDYERASREMRSWMADGTPIMEEKAITFNFPNGDASMEIENGKTRSITVTKDRLTLICSFRGTPSGERCLCRRNPDEE